MIARTERFGDITVLEVLGEDWVVVGDDHGVISRGTAAEVHVEMEGCSSYPSEAIEFVRELAEGAGR